MEKISELNTRGPWYGPEVPDESGIDYTYDESAYGLHGIGRC